MAEATGGDVEKLVESLKRNRFAAEFARDAETAARLVLDMIPVDATVTVPGSTTIRQIGLVARLKARGTRVIDIMTERISPGEPPADILLTSSNAVTLDGKLVNIDRMGNRVAGMVFGPKKVIVIIGINKVVRDVYDAINRIKNVIAPYHAQTRGSKTPCAIKGYCTDCDSPDRICGVTTIIEKKPSRTDTAIILVGEDLGLGWDSEWPRERKERIATVYRETLHKY